MVYPDEREICRGKDYVTVIQLNGSDLVGLHLLSTTHKVLTGTLLQLL